MDFWHFDFFEQSKSFREIGIWLQIASEMSDGDVDGGCFASVFVDVHHLWKNFGRVANYFGPESNAWRVNKLQWFWQCILTSVGRVLTRRISKYDRGQKRPVRGSALATVRIIECKTEKRRNTEKEKNVCRLIARQADSNENVFTQLEFQFYSRRPNWNSLLFWNSAILYRWTGRVESSARVLLHATLFAGLTIAFHEFRTTKKHTNRIKVVCCLLYLRTPADRKTIDNPEHAVIVELNSKFFACSSAREYFTIYMPCMASRSR